MINPILSKGRFLFVREGCEHCKKWKKFIYQLNLQLKIEKRIKIIDCTKHYLYGIYDHPIIELFDKYIDDFPTIFIEGEKKVGTNSVVECIAWLRTRLFDDFYFPQAPDYLEEIDKYTIFNQRCRFRRGRIICERLD